MDLRRRTDAHCDAPGLHSVRELPTVLALNGPAAQRNAHQCVCANSSSVSANETKIVFHSQGQPGAVLALNEAQARRNTHQCVCANPSSVSAYVFHSPCSQGQPGVDL